MKWAILILFNCICSLTIAVATIPTQSPSTGLESQFPVPTNLEKKVNLPARIQQLTALPLITFYDSEQGQVYNWWAEDQGQGIVADLSPAVFKNLIFKDFPLVFCPVHSAQVKLPSAYKKTELTRLQMIALAKAFKAPYIVIGDVVLSESPLVAGAKRVKVQWEVISVHNGERVHELLRISEVLPQQLIPSGTSEILAKNIFAESLKAIGEGVLERQKKTQPQWIDVVVTGPMNYGQVQKLKRILQSQVQGVKSLQEKSLANEQIVWNVDYQGSGAQGLSAALSQVNPHEFYWQVAQSDAGQVLLDVKVKPQ